MPGGTGGVRRSSQLLLLGRGQVLKTSICCPDSGWRRRGDGERLPDGCFAHLHAKQRHPTSLPGRPGHLTRAHYCLPGGARSPRTVPFHERTPVRAPASPASAAIGHSPSHLASQGRAKGWPAGVACRQPTTDPGRGRGANGPTSPSLPIWLLVPDLRPGLLPDSIPGLEPHPEWTEILARVQAEQAGKQLHVVVYPCAAL